MEKIEINKIRGEYIEVGEMGSLNQGKITAGGNDTITSIKMVAEKVNEIIDWINSHA